MKNILKKNQVIITALAIMIVVAGYLTFTQDKAKDTKDAAYQTAEMTTVEDQLNAATDDILNVDDATSEVISDDVDIVGTTDISDEDNLAYDDANAEKVAKDDQSVEATTEDTKAADASTEDTKANDVAKEETTETTAQTKESKDSVGEAVLVNKTIGSDFFSSAVLQREQTRAMNKETLMELVNNKNISEKQKQDALDKVIEMTAIAEKEDAAETLLLAKGFTGAVISIIDGDVDVVVGVPAVTEQAIAQVEDIVKRKTGIEATHIHINPVVVNEEE